MQGDSRLTSRQKDIIQYLRLGCTNQEISQYLEISVNTVKTHIAALYRALGATNRTEAVHMLADELSNSDLPRRNDPTPSRALAPTIAVLPFSIPNSLPLIAEDALRLEESLAFHLTQWRRFTIVGRDTIAPLPDTELTTLQERFGARYAIAASLRENAGRQLNLRLLSTSHGHLHWASEFDLEEYKSSQAANLLSVHLAAIVTFAILKVESGRFARESLDLLCPVEKANRGAYLLESRTAHDYRAAMLLFRSALEDSPAVPIAHFGMALGSYLNVLEQWDNDVSASRERVFEHARACIKLDSNSHDSLLVLALSHILEGRSQDAIDLLTESLMANPGSSSALSLLGQLHAIAGRTELSCSYFEQCARISLHTPAYRRNQIALAMLRFALGDYPGVVEACRGGLVYDTGHIGFQALLIAASALLDDIRASGFADSLLKTRPDFNLSELRPFLHQIEPSHRTRLITGLRKAGLPIEAA